MLTSTDWRSLLLSDRSISDFRVLDLGIFA